MESIIINNKEFFIKDACQENNLNKINSFKTITNLSSGYFLLKKDKIIYLVDKFIDAEFKEIKE